RHDDDDRDLDVPGRALRLLAVRALVTVVPLIAVAAVAPGGRGCGARPLGPAGAPGAGGFVASCGGAIIVGHDWRLYAPPAAHRADPPIDESAGRHLVVGAGAVVKLER